MSRAQLFFILPLAFAAIASAPARASELPRWEAGAGVGYLRFEQYPASNQFTHLTLPFPTFQYRGDILRADDREGAKLYLLKRQDFRLQLGGHAFMPLGSSGNDARRGMDDLPLLLALGPQVQWRAGEHWSLRSGLYPALTANLVSAQPRGGIWELQLTYRNAYALSGWWGGFGFEGAASFLSFDVMIASQEVHELYFGVPSAKVTSERPRFDARSGFFHSQLTLFQSFRRGDFAFYVGARVADYRWSASRESPLHKSDQNIAALIGVTHTFYKSRRAGKSEDEASGAVEKIREMRRRPELSEQL